MADVNDDDDKTLDTSNSGESEDQTDDSVDQSDQVDDNSAGKAAETDQTDDDSSDDKAEGKKPRGEVRHERFIDKLSAEIRQSNENSTHFTEELFAPKPYQPLEFKEGEELDRKVLEEDRKNVAENARNDGIQTGLRQGTSQVVQELWADRFDIDSDRVTARWDALNPENTETYDPKLEASLVQKYIAFTGVEKDPKTGRITIQKPNVRFKDFVEAEMKNLEDYAARHREISTKNRERQAAKAGLRPTGQARPPKGGHGFDPNDPVGSVARMSKKQYFELGGKEASDAYLAERGLGSKV